MSNFTEDRINHMIDKRHRIFKGKVEYKKRRQYPEFTIHREIADYCFKTFISGQSMWHTTENSNGGGSEQARRQQSKLKLLGVQAGFPDGIIFHEGNKIILVEIKSKTGTLQPNQKEMHDNLRTMGFTVELVRSLDQFRELVKKYSISCREIM